MITRVLSEDPSQHSIAGQQQELAEDQAAEEQSEVQQVEDNGEQAVEIES